MEMYPHADERGDSTIKGKFEFQPPDVVSITRAKLMKTNLTEGDKQITANSS
jgi:hypothetical protein